MIDSFDTIIFDLGNVLIDFNHRIAVERISKFTTKTPEEIYQLFFDSELTGIFEEGKITGQDFFARVKEMLKFNLAYEEFLPIWNEIFFITPHNLAVQRLIKDLKNNYKIVLISNINELHFTYLKNKFDIFSGFNKIILSFEVGVRKPDPKIYLRALELVMTTPQKVVYTDDRLDLVEAAAKLGITSIHFKGMDFLKENLIKLKINFNHNEI